MPTKNTKLIIGLGNPGKKYNDTRHNIGFFIVDSFFRHHCNKLPENQYKDFQPDNKLESLIATITMDDTKYILAKPQTFMNLSGRAVQKILSFYHLIPTDMLVIHDELDLPLGKIRLSKSASAGGHNGIKSIIEMLGTQDFFRLRIGISQPDPGSAQKKMDPADFVLQKFPAKEASAIGSQMTDILDSIISLFEQGFEKTATRYNK